MTTAAAVADDEEERTASAKSPIGSGGGLSLIHLARASSQLSPARVPLVTAAAACARVFVCTSETLGAFRFCTYGLRDSPRDTARRPRNNPPAPAAPSHGHPQPPPVGLVPSLHYPFSYHHPTSPWNALRDCRRRHRHRHFCAAADGRSPRQRPRRLSDILYNTHRAQLGDRTRALSIGPASAVLPK